MEIKVFESAWFPGEWVAVAHNVKYDGHTAVGDTKYDALERLAQYCRCCDGASVIDMRGMFRREA